jgi:hypothetical protein
MVAQWGTWQPRRPGLRIVHRLLVVLVGVFMVGSMLFWSWLFFTGHWAS